MFILSVNSFSGILVGLLSWWDLLEWTAAYLTAPGLELAAEFLVTIPFSGHSCCTCAFISQIQHGVCSVSASNHQVPAYSLLPLYVTAALSPSHDQSLLLWPVYWFLSLSLHLLTWGAQSEQVAAMTVNSMRHVVCPFRPRNLELLKQEARIPKGQLGMMLSEICCTFTLWNLDPASLSIGDIEPYHFSWFRAYTSSWKTAPCPHRECSPSF